MKLSDLTTRAGEWLRGSGPMSEIVISSRIRLARNLAGHPFLGRASRTQRNEDDGVEQKPENCGGKERDDEIQRRGDGIPAPVCVGHRALHRIGV